MGFLSPWWLAGLLTLGVPVFVHLLRKHVTTPRPMGSLMFFERGVQSSTKHRRLKHLLLFALRFALILLLILAFANPFIRRKGGDASSRLLVVVIDRSLSMRAGTHLADAKQQALAIIAAKPKEQRAEVMALGGQLALMTQPTADEAQLKAAIEAVEPGDDHANFGELGQGMRTLAESFTGSMEVHLFSDLQRSAMPGNFADMVMPPSATLHLHALTGKQPEANWTVESVEAPPVLSDPKDPKVSHVKAVVAGFHTPAVSRSVALVVNGRTVATKTVSVPADGRASVEFAPLDIGYGFNRCEVRLLPAGDLKDALPADDASFFTVRRSDPERVLFVHAAADTRSAFFFGTALQAASQGAFLLQSVTAEESTDLDPTKFSFVVLNDAEQLPSLFERTLAQYVAKGGRVLLALGPGAVTHERLPLWPMPAGAVHDSVRDGAPAGVGSVDFTFAATADRAPGRDNGGWAGVRFYRTVQVDATGARVAMRLADGTPLLMDRSVGEGHVLVFASGFDNLTNDLPLHGVFVALVDRTARYLSGEDRLSGARVVDDFVQLRTGEAAGGLAPVEVTGPDGKRPLSLEEARHAQALRLEQAGFYQILLANGRDAVLGVTPDRRESDLEGMPPDLQQLWSGAARTSETGTAAVNHLPEPMPEPVSLWWWVMLLALLTAVAETALASGYMGTQREDA